MWGKKLRYDDREAVVLCVQVCREVAGCLEMLPRRPSSSSFGACCTSSSCCGCCENVPCTSIDCTPAFRIRDENGVLLCTYSSMIFNQVLRFLAEGVCKSQMAHIPNSVCKLLLVLHCCCTALLYASLEQHIICDEEVGRLAMGRTEFRISPAGIFLCCRQASSFRASALLKVEANLEHAFIASLAKQ